MEKQNVTLPAWATLDADHADQRVCVIDIDAAAAYPALLEELGFEGVDQYELQVAHECIKLSVQQALAGSELDPRVSGKVAQFHISAAPEFAQAGKPVGRGPDAASKGQEARQHFARIRGKSALVLATE
jgi:hypothetical protein